MDTVPQHAGLRLRRALSYVALAAVAVVLASIAADFLVVSRFRPKRRLSERNLRALTTAVVQYSERNGALPESLTRLVREGLVLDEQLVSPRTGTPYRLSPLPMDLARGAWNPFIIYEQGPSSMRSLFVLCDGTAGSFGQPGASK